MQELVGHCKECNNNIYCNDGFLNGIVLDDKSIVCFECSADQLKDKDINI